LVSIGTNVRFFQLSRLPRQFFREQNGRESAILGQQPCSDEWSKCSVGNQIDLSASEHDVQQALFKLIWEALGQVEACT
jgi:hypothetical protein